jgi:hypothetical protein
MAIAAAQTVHHDLDLWTGTLALTVVDANGNAVDGVEVQAIGDAKDARAPLPRTDARGATSAEVTATTFRLRTLPKRLQPLEARNKLRQEVKTAGTGSAQDDPLGPFWIRVGTVTVSAGQSASLEVRLPAEWDE